MKRYFTVLLFSSLILLSVPQTTYAAVNPLQAVREWGLDTVSYFISGLLTGDLSRSTTDWVNSGFGALARSVKTDPDTGEPEVSTFYSKGGAAFVVNPKTFFENLASGSTQAFVKQIIASKDPITNLDGFLPGFTDDILDEIHMDTLNETGDFFEIFKSDFSGVEGQEKLNAYLNNFSAGGWDTFLQTTQVCVNNYDCSKLAVLAQLSAQNESAIQTSKSDMDSNGGFLSMKQCVKTADEQENFEHVIPDESGCVEWQNTTPGSLIGKQIAKATTIEYDRASSADEFSEIFAVIIERVVNNLIQSGLSSLSGTLQGNDSANATELNNRRDSIIKDNKNLNNKLPEDGKKDFGKLLGSDICESAKKDPGSGNTGYRDPVCTSVKSVSLNNTNHESTIPVSYSGSESRTIKVQKNFGEYDKYISVNPSEVDLVAGNNSKDIKIKIINYDEFIKEIGDINELSGTITVGDLVIEVNGEDLAGGSIPGGSIDQRANPSIVPTGSTKPCGTPSSGGSICVDSKTNKISLVMNNSGAKRDLRISYENANSTDDYKSNINYSFGEDGKYNSIVNISRSSLRIGGRDSQIIRIEIADPDEIDAIEDFSTFSGTIGIDGLVIEVQGKDDR